MQNLPSKLIIQKLVKKFPAFIRTEVYKTLYLDPILSQFCSEFIITVYSHKFHSDIILPVYSYVFQPIFCMYFLGCHECHVPRPSHNLWLNYTKNIG
jgi:hypothetical protein